MIRIDAPNDLPSGEVSSVPEQPSRSALLGLTLAFLLVVSGCVGSSPGQWATTDGPNPAAPTTSADATSDGTTGDTAGNLTAEEVLQRVEEKQRAVEGYSATVVRRTDISLTNGSSITRERSERLDVKYGNDTAPAFYRRVSSYDGERRRVYVANAEHRVSYNVTGERYRYDERTDDHFGSQYSLDELHWAEHPEVLLRENTATYEGIETVNGREAYVITFTAKNRNEEGVTQLAYFDEQTYWFDTETGILLKHVAHKPVRRFNHAVSELRDPENDTSGFRDEDGENAVYLEHKVRTTVVTNLTVNPDFPTGTFAFDPPADAQPAGAPDDDESEDD